MRYPPQFVHSGVCRGSRSPYGLSGKGIVEHDPAPAVHGQNLRGSEIHAGRIVLIRYVHAHLICRGIGGLGQRLAPRIMCLVGNGHPIDHAQHCRFFPGQQNHTSRAERIDNPLDRLHEPVAKRTSDPRSHVTLKGCDVQWVVLGHITLGAALADKTEPHEYDVDAEKDT